ncbi:hypothetical protein Y1Q_0024193 [Alligator mississippiensis]|uniref:EF-hand domain-containing protein n=1 Tax=Alligator mississippiensis TaxID=8496 RepID=A0A151NI11_ALLMI|nr:hypothetical protein Y1Q_0024193 [Alligator mississippiensis]
MHYFGGNQKILKVTSRSSWQPCLSSQENVFKQLALKNPALNKTVPYYTSFVTSVTLWDRGVYHHDCKHHHKGPSLPCPRFTAHMKISPGTHESTYMLGTAFQDLPVKEINQNREIISTQRCPWKNSGSFRRGQKQVFQTKLPIYREYKVPKLPPPSLASSEEDLAHAVIHPHAPSMRNQEVPLAEATRSTEEKKEPEGPKLLGQNTEINEDTGLEELDRVQDSTIPLVSEMESTCSNISRSTSSVISNQTSFSFERDTNWSDFSRKLSSATISRKGSTPLSQLRSSSFSMSAMASSDTELEADSSSSQVSNQSALQKSSLMVANGYCNNILNPSLNSSSYHGTADNLQGSSYSVKKCSGQTPSFVEIWHDRLLHHWPVLPPISPQRAFSDTSCHVRSQVTELTSGMQEAFEELEGISIFSGSSLSQENRSDSFDETSTHLSEASQRAVSLSIGCISEDESLTEVRLSLLDHQNWEKADQDTGNQNNMEEWGNATEEISGLKIKNIMGFTALDANGFLLHPAPAFLKENKTSDTYSNNGIADQQSIYTMSDGIISGNTLKNEAVQPNKDGRIKSSTTGASLDKGYGSAFQLTDMNETAPKMENGEAHFTGQTHKIQVCTGLEEPAEDSHEESYCIGAETRRDSQSPANRESHFKLDNGSLQEIEQQQKAKERQAQVLHIYSKLCETQAPAHQPPETTTISKFEDFDFLAKYCIFSQEKLAKYKRAFEAVDTDGDGYLNCMQVLMALKEIVPSEALTDAEELYVYRILEIVDYYVTDGLTDLRLFAVMASLAQKIASLDNFMKSLIGRMDFKALELKIYKAKQLFLWNIDSQSCSFTVDQFLVELKAGGISEEHEAAVQRELKHIKKLDVLDFLTYLPLFVLIHNSVIANPLDDSRTI